MEKVITLSLEKAAFFRSLFDGTIKASTEEALLNKLEVYKSLKGVKEKIKDLLALKEKNRILSESTSDDEAGKKRALEMIAKAEELEKNALSEMVEITMPLDILNWVKEQWKEVPKLYKLFDAKTGQAVQEGFSSEEDCEFYFDIKVAFEDARVKKEEDNVADKKAKK